MTTQEKRYGKHICHRSKTCSRYTRTYHKRR